jgi:hypothetical protein
MTDWQFIGRYVLTVFCMFAVGTIRHEAVCRQRKWLLWFLILPGAILSYEAWFILKVVARDVRHNWRVYFFVLWVGLTYYLWYRGNEYKKQLEQRFVKTKAGRPGRINPESTAPD